MSLDQIGPLSERHSAIAFIHDVLLVSDDAEHVARVKGLLAGAGYQITVARDGGQARGSFRMRQPDMVLLSIILPGESGFEICEHMKQTDQFVPVLMLTEISSRAARELAARVGADGYLTRPFEDDALVEMVHEIGQAVWDRKRGVEHFETRKIEFKCACGRRFRVPFANRGKMLNCPKCNEKVVVPMVVENDEADARAFRAGASATPSASSTEPLRFVTVRCQHCGTNYHLFPGALEKARFCPKCHQRQVGSLSFAPMALTRAALASSRRVLIILTGRNKGKKLLLPGKEVTIGRDKSCVLSIRAEGIEERHCALRPTMQGIAVRDLDTPGGTFVNDTRIAAETLLEPGDVLRVGPLKLQLAGDKSAAEDSPDVSAGAGDSHQPAEATAPRKPRSIADEAADVIHRHWEAIRKLAGERVAADTHSLADGPTVTTDVPAASSAE
ncbi:MAG: response regulator [Planctomycetaceae bacterium]